MRFNYTINHGVYKVGRESKRNHRIPKPPSTPGYSYGIIIAVRMTTPHSHHHS